MSVQLAWVTTSHTYESADRTQASGAEDFWDGLRTTAGDPTVDGDVSFTRVPTGSP